VAKNTQDQLERRRLKVEGHGCNRLEIEVEKTQLEAELSTNGTKRRQMVAPEWYNGEVLVYYAISESNEFFKRTERRTLKVE
jgi:hypothetical protein